MPVGAVMESVCLPERWCTDDMYGEGTTWAWCMLAEMWCLRACWMLYYAPRPFFVFATFIGEGTTPRVSKPGAGKAEGNGKSLLGGNKGSINNSTSTLVWSCVFILGQLWISQLMFVNIWPSFERLKVKFSRNQTFCNIISLYVCKWGSVTPPVFLHKFCLCQHYLMFWFQIWCLF